MQHLHLVSPPVKENKDVSTQWIAPKSSRHDPAETVKSFPQIGVLTLQKKAERSVQRKHYFNNSLTKESSGFPKKSSLLPDAK
jgi:hypothetical protein